MCVGTPEPHLWLNSLATCILRGKHHHCFQSCNMICTNTGINTECDVGSGNTINYAIGQACIVLFHAKREGYYVTLCASYYHH